MNIVRRTLNARRIAAVAFAVLFLAVPIALLTSVRLEPLLLAVLTLGFVSLLGGLTGPRQIRGKLRNGANGLITAAALLAILHYSGLLEPMYRREGWLLLDLQIEVAPLQVKPGDAVTYTLSTTNPGQRAALGRRFVVDGTAYTGLLLYGRLPDLRGERFAILGSPTVVLSSELEPDRPLTGNCTIVYANPGIPELNPTSWHWTTTYSPGDEVVAAITSDGHTHRDLGAGETLTLQYRVVVPSDHPDGELHHVRASLSYRDPQWATYATHDLRFPFEDTVIVGEEEQNGGETR